MGFRFRKAVRILPGLRLNITKHGISSVSVGGRGISYNIGKKGTRATGGIPGSGLSYSEYDAYNKETAETEVNRETGEITERKVVKSGPPILIIFFIALIVIGIYAFRS